MIKIVAGQTRAEKAKDNRAWFLQHPEFEHRPAGIRTFIESEEYLNAGNECWPNIKDDLEALFSGNYTEAVFCYAIGSGKSMPEESESTTLQQLPQGELQSTAVTESEPEVFWRRTTAE